MAPSFLGLGVTCFGGGGLLPCSTPKANAVSGSGSTASPQITSRWALILI